MTGGQDTPAKTSKTGKSRNAIHPNVKWAVSAPATSWVNHLRDKPQRRLSPEDIHARLILIIGVTLSVVFAITSIGIVYALIFVTQPIGAQAENDKAFIDLLKTLAIFLTGSLGGVLAGNGLKAKSKPDTPPKG